MQTRLIREVLVLAFCLVSATAFGQRYGLRGGVQKTSVVTDEAGETFGTETGLTLGGFLNINLPANLAVSADGMYTQKIITQQNVSALQGGPLNPEVTLQLGTIEIPVVLAWRVPVSGPVRPRLYGGPVIGVIVDQQVDLNDKAVGEAVNEALVLTRDAFSDREVGWTAGAGLSIGLANMGFNSIHLLLDLRYERGITSVADDFAGNPLSKTVRIGAFTGLIGVGF
ncbi:MAG: porin family protein [Rhodothermales bacterium]